MQSDALGARATGFAQWGVSGLFLPRLNSQWPARALMALVSGHQLVPRCQLQPVRKRCLLRLSLSGSRTAHLRGMVSGSSPDGFTALRTDGDICFSATHRAGVWCSIAFLQSTGTGWLAQLQPHGIDCSARGVVQLRKLRSCTFERTL
jgi:hypothetical protein